MGTHSASPPLALLLTSGEAFMRILSRRSIGEGEELKEIKRWSRDRDHLTVRSLIDGQ
ncbi:hypothetical protein QJS10_CPA01g02004 [Acorus calamus]|uniref:Uncharacterized protein n=1 Tax=Acorus calamus TaxID=4465 RepID=A0AAV9FQ52_ACOCL|nr:hypothetical protein QJS10_CPA01g02004 [Acorus calamus]